MFFYLIIKSKNEKSLSTFLTIFKKILYGKNLNFTNNKKLIKRFTFLKSPHVNKTAQEHFNFIVFSKIACVKNFQIFKMLMILKKIKNHLCCDVIIKIKFSLLKNKTPNFLKKSELKIGNINNKLKIQLLNYHFYGKVI